MQRGFLFLTGTEVMRLQHLLDAAVEVLDHAICLRVRRWGEAVVDAEVGAANRRVGFNPPAFSNRKAARHRQSPPRCPVDPLIFP